MYVHVFIFKRIMFMHGYLKKAKNSSFDPW